MNVQSKTVLEMVAMELDAARAKHPPHKSLHEGYAVLLEEVEEFWAEVKKKSEERSPSRMLEELIQVAAMAVRTAEDVILGPTEKRDKIRFNWNGNALTTDRPILGVTREMPDDEATFYHGRYFVCETIGETAARRMAEALGGFFFDAR